MGLRLCRFAALVLTALALTMTSAHVLELPQKLAYDPAMYAAVNTTLYRWFAIVGSFYTAAAIAAAFAAAVLAHGRPGFRLAVVAAAALLLAFVSWLAIVMPVNLEIGVTMHTAADQVPAAWQRLRLRWELGHALGFALTLGAFCCLAASVLADTPPRRLSTVRAAPATPPVRSGRGAAW